MAREGWIWSDRGGEREREVSVRVLVVMLGAGVPVGNVVARFSGRGDRGVGRAGVLVVVPGGWTAQARGGSARIASRIVVNWFCQGQRAGIRSVHWRLVRVRRAGIWKR